MIAQIEHVTCAAKDEKEEVLHLNQTIDKISGVVQDNSAVAEETSATGLELSDSAANLNDLISHFQLRTNH